MKWHWLYKLRGSIACIQLCFVMTATASAVPLPDPLSLSEALALSSESHPELAKALAELNATEAEALRIYADDDIDIGAKLIGRYVEPNRLAIDQSHDDSQAKLFARKRLYDFGYTQRLEEAAEATVQGGQYRYKLIAQHHKLEIMRLFFDVILADLEYAKDNEAMAIAYVQVDRARDQRELGQISDVELLIREENYQRRLMKRVASEGRLRTQRARLAQALNRPDELPNNLLMPELRENQQTLPDYEDLVAYALEKNPERQALYEELQAAQLRTSAQKAANRPTLSASIETLASRRDLGSRNPVEAGVTLEIPIYQGERIKADIAKARAEVRSIQANLVENEYKLRQVILEIWQEIQVLQKQREMVTVFTDLKELEFDRAQAHYELELTTDFGESLVGQSQAKFIKAQTEFDLALHWAKLAILTSQPYSRILSPDPPNSAILKNSD